MNSRELVFYEGNDVTLRGTFEIDNVAQTPDAGSALIQIMERTRGIASLAETAASISGTQVYYKWSNLVRGVYRAFLSATFGTGADKRSGIIEFVVRRKDAR